MKRLVNPFVCLVALVSNLSVAQQPQADAVDDVDRAMQVRVALGRGVDRGAFYGLEGAEAAIVLRILLACSLVITALIQCVFGL